MRVSATDRQNFVFAVLDRVGEFADTEASVPLALRIQMLCFLQDHMEYLFEGCPDAAQNTYDTLTSIIQSARMDRKIYLTLAPQILCSMTTIVCTGYERWLSDAMQNLQTLLMILLR